MRENRPSGSEGGATELNRSLLPLSSAQEHGAFEYVTPPAVCATAATGGIATAATGGIATAATGGIATAATGIWVRGFKRDRAYSSTPDRNFKLCGIWSTTVGDSSSMK